MYSNQGDSPLNLPTLSSIDFDEDQLSNDLSFHILTRILSSKANGRRSSFRREKFRYVMPNMNSSSYASRYSVVV